MSMPYDWRRNWVPIEEGPKEEGPDCKPLDEITKLKERMRNVEHQLDELWTRTGNMMLIDHDQMDRLNWMGPRVWALDNHAVGN